MPFKIRKNKSKSHTSTLFNSATKLFIFFLSFSTAINKHDVKKPDIVLKFFFNLLFVH